MTDKTPFRNKNRLDRKIAAPCGLYCGFCPCFTKEQNPHCSGSHNLKRHPFWGKCKLYACATEHEVEHCDLCTGFLCGLFVGHFEGSPDSIEGQRDTILRVGLLAYRSKFGTEKYLKLVNKLRK